MKTMLSLCIMVIFFVMQSCGSGPAEKKRVSLTAIEGDYYVLSFNGECGSADLQHEFIKKKYSMIKMEELKALLNKVKNQSQKARLYGTKKYSGQATSILKKLSTVQILQPEKYAPIFHRKERKIIADWGDFNPGWSSGGWVVVKKNKK